MKQRWGSLFISHYPKHAQLLFGESDDRVFLSYKGINIDGIYDGVSNSWMFKYQNKAVAHQANHKRTLPDMLRLLYMMGN